jgi:hypothetical protein
VRPAALLSAYAAALVLAFGAAAGVGSAVGPVGTAVEPSSGMTATDDQASAAHGDDGAHGDDAGHGDESDPATAGLAATGLGVAEDGYLLRLQQPVLAAGTSTEFRFVVEDADGEPLTDYRVVHDKELHLVVARRDLTGFQHLHPTRGADGTWSVRLTLPDAGPYKVFTDFTPKDRETSVVLAADLAVPGEYAPGPPPEPVAVATVDGYEVALDGQLVAGTRSELTLTVRRDGRPVEDLQPYLGAFGHLVALRDGDLAYLHVHADESAGSGPQLSFAVDVPAAATYRLFLDFRHGDVVRTAALTATASNEGTTR